jgi:hypothetical protein
MIITYYCTSEKGFNSLKFRNKTEANGIIHYIVINK